jgi:hypothetical protein
VSNDGEGAGYLPPTEAAALRRVLAAAGIRDRHIRAELTGLLERVHAVGNAGGYDRGYLDGYADRDADHPPMIVDEAQPDRGPAVFDAEPPAELRAAPATVQMTAAPVPPWDDQALAALDPTRRGASSDFPSGGP